MKTSVLVACDLNRLIGYNNTIPWHYKQRYPEIQPSVRKDLKFFRSTTVGRPIIMGRTTFRTLPKPLKKRLNIVLSSKYSLDTNDDEYRVITCRNWDEALSVASEHAVDDEAFIIGGASVYRQAFDFVDAIYQTTFNIAFQPGLGVKVYCPPIPESFQLSATIEENEFFKIEKFTANR